MRTYNGAHEMIVSSTTPCPSIYFVCPFKSGRFRRRKKKTRKKKGKVFYFVLKAVLQFIVTINVFYNGYLNADFCPVH